MTTILTKTPIESLSSAEQDAIFRLSRMQDVFIEDINGELWQVLDMTERAPMKYIDVLRFKNNKRIDWVATESTVIAYYKSEFATMRPSEMVMSVAADMKLIRKFVKKWRVSVLYDAQKEIKAKKENT